MPLVLLDAPSHRIGNRRPGALDALAAWEGLLDRSSLLLTGGKHRLREDALFESVAEIEETANEGEGGHG